MMRLGVFWGIVLGMSLSCVAEMRYWHDRDGKEYYGEFSKEVFGNVYLRGTDGKVFPVAATNLVDSDMDAIRQLRPPKIKVKFTRELLEVNDYPPEYDPDTWNDIEIDVTGTVEVHKLSKLPYTGMLRGELYLIAQEVATDDYRLFGKKGFAVTFPSPEDNVFTTSLTRMLRTYDSDDETRGARYKGYVVVIESSEGEPLVFATNLSWMKADKLEALRKIPCPGFMDDECNKRSVPRPKGERDIDPQDY
jgi:hypothetical protein